MISAGYTALWLSHVATVTMNVYTHRHINQLMLRKVQEIRKKQEFSTKIPLKNLPKRGITPPLILTAIANPANK